MPVEPDYTGQEREEAKQWIRTHRDRRLPYSTSRQSGARTEQMYDPSMRWEKERFGKLDRKTAENLQWLTPQDKLDTRQVREDVDAATAAAAENIRRQRQEILNTQASIKNLGNQAYFARQGAFEGLEQSAADTPIARAIARQQQQAQMNQALAMARSGRGGFNPAAYRVAQQRAADAAPEMAAGIAQAAAQERMQALGQLGHLSTQQGIAAAQMGGQLGLGALGREAAIRAADQQTALALGQMDIGAEQAYQQAQYQRELQARQMALGQQAQAAQNRNAILGGVLGLGGAAISGIASAFR